MLPEEIIKRRGKVIATKTPLSIEIKRSVYMLFFALLSIIVIVSGVFLLNGSQTNQKGYSLKQEQDNKDQLIEQSRNIIKKLIQAQSFDNIQNNQLVKAMIKPENTIYLDDTVPIIPKSKKR